MIFVVSLCLWRWASMLPPSLLLSWVTPFLCILFAYYGWVSWKSWWMRWIAWIVALWIFALVIEYIGTTTCFPYGCFEYTSLLWPHLGPIPFLLLCIRPVLVYSMIWVASLLPWEKYHRALWSILCLLLLDLALDPVHVAQGIWSYTNKVWRYSVPRSNCLWWLFTGSISIFLFFAITTPTKNTYPLAFIVWGVGMLGYFWGLFGGMLL